jgi:propionyl-CoA synthetase
LNHWWQTETGHSITASCLGFGHNLKPPMFSAGMPFPGYDGNFLEYRWSIDNIYVLTNLLK